MDGKHLNKIRLWINTTNEIIYSDNSYFDSYHIDESINCSKEEWIEKSFELYDLINEIIKKDKYEGMLCLLAIELNRKRKSKDLISNIDYNCIDKQSTPPEIYLLSIDNIDLLDDILLGTIKTSFDISKESTIFYKEKWNHGYDRYLWIIPNDYIRKREKI